MRQAADTPGPLPAPVADVESGASPRGECTLSIPVAKILTAGVLVGILDGLFAVVLYVAVLKLSTPIRVFQGVAAAVLGRESFQGGLATFALGLAMHFAVAHAWAIVYFLLLQGSAALRRLVQAPARAVVIGMAFGALVWVVMDLVVLPLTRARPTPVASGMFLTMLIGHMFVVGLPIALVLRPTAAPR
jgi:hypothetical protein